MSFPVIGGKQGRVDQGVDFSGVGATVHAIGDGVVKSIGRWNGWPGNGGLVYNTGGRNIFIQEDFVPASGLRPGQRISAGQILGRIGPGSSGIEMGYADAAGLRPLVPYNGLPDGTPTAGGKAFARTLQALKGKSPAKALAVDVAAYRKAYGHDPPKAGSYTGGVPIIGAGNQQDLAHIIDTGPAAQAAVSAAAAGANAALGALWDAVGKDATRALLYVVLVGAGVALALSGASRALGGAPGRAVKAATSHVPIPVPV